jgi:hypothetical protein
MNALRNWIIDNGYAATDAKEVLERLSDQVEVHRDSQRWTMAGVMDRLGPEAVIAIDRKLRAADLGVFSQALASGIQFDARSTRDALMLCGQMRVLEAAEVDALLAIGLRYGPAWEKAGLQALPTVEEIQAVQATIATEAERELVARAYQVVKGQHEAGEKNPETWIATFSAVVRGEWMEPDDSELEEISR